MFIMLICQGLDVLTPQCVSETIIPTSLTLTHFQSSSIQLEGLTLPPSRCYSRFDPYVHERRTVPWVFHG